MTAIRSPLIANYIIKFKKDASSSDIEKFYDDISKQGEPLVFFDRYFERKTSRLIADGWLDCCRDHVGGDVKAKKHDSKREPILLSALPRQSVLAAKHSR